MKLINCEASDVWDYFQKQKEQLQTHMEIIAENPEFDVVIYLTAESRGSYSDGKEMVLPNIIVYIDGNESYEEAAVNEDDCSQTAKRIYYEYLTDERLINRIIEEDMASEDEDDRQQQIDEREEDIDTAVSNFLQEILIDPLEDIVGSDDADEIYEDVKEHILEYLYRKWDLDIYRPMFLEDEDGEEFFEEYPYGSMEFDDEDNPLYN